MPFLLSPDLSLGGLSVLSLSLILQPASFGSLDLELFWKIVITSFFMICCLLYAMRMIPSAPDFFSFRSYDRFSKNLSCSGDLFINPLINRLAACLKSRSKIWLVNSIKFSRQLVGVSLYHCFMYRSTMDFCCRQLLWYCYKNFLLKVVKLPRDHSGSWLNQVRAFPVRVVVKSLQVNASDTHSMVILCFKMK